MLKLTLAYIILARHLAQGFSDAGTLTHVLIVNTISTIGVPTFFIVSGFLLYRNGTPKHKHVISQIKRILLLYLVWSIIYLPLNIRGILISENKINGVREYFQNVVFSGSYYHLWYLPALAVGIGLVYWLRKAVHNKKVILIILIALFVIGLFGDSWNCWNIVSVESVFAIYRKIFVTTRNGLFFAPIFVYIGELIAERTESFSRKNAVIGLTAGCVLLFIESYLLYCSAPDKVNNMMLSTLLISPALVVLCVSKISEKGYPTLRGASTVVFCIHPWVITASLSLLKGFSDEIKIFFIIITVTLIGIIVPLLTRKIKVLKLLT
ncbi:MAG: acyltransferase [Eubacterium sp.]|nr:acyltransferase [Eubacterium sp.]